jgi:hypothetical protein
MDEGDTAMRMTIRGHFTPSIDETDDNATGNENAVDFEKVHTGLQGYGGQTYSAVF